MEKSLEEIKQELQTTIDNFYKEYSLPPQNITDNEWDTLLEVVEAHFIVHNIKDEYIYAMNIIIRRALFFAQVSKEEDFNITHLRRALIDLVAFKIPSKEIQAMQEEIDEMTIRHTK